MIDERDDPLLEACLEEVLGGQRPPDLTERILGAWQAQGGRPAAAPARPIPLGPPVAVPPRGLPAAAMDNGRVRRAAPRISWLVAAACLLLAAGLGIVLGGRGLWPQPQPAPLPVTDRTPLPRGGDAREAAPRPQAEPPGGSPSEAPRGEQTPSDDADLEHQPFPAQPRFARDDPPALPPLVVGAPSPPLVAATDAEVLQQINRRLRQRWEAAGVRPAPPADDAHWCRRAYVRLLGRIPTVEELQRFLARPAPTRKSDLVEELLGSGAHGAEFARNWAGIWTNALIGRTGGMQADELARREGLEQYLREALERNEPFDRVARELIAAQGSATPGTADHNGAVNFLLANAGDRQVQATARTCRVFLGMQLHCAQCHNHPFNDWTQQQFWELNAFFRQVQTGHDRQRGTAYLIDGDFAGEGSTPSPDEAEVYFEQRNGELKIAYPVFLDGTRLPPTGRVAEVNRRTELARLVTESSFFRRAVVNRLWGQVLGFGLTRPVDDMGPHNPPSHAELLDGLADQFAAHGYDLRRLHRWIVLSDAFGLSSEVTDANRGDDPEQEGARPLFARYYTRQLQAEEVYQSLQLLAESRRNPLAAPGAAEDRSTWLAQFSIAMNNDEREETSLFNGSLRQTLTLMNGDLMRRVTRTTEGSLLQRVADSGMSPAQQVEHLFQAAVARPPTPRELEAARRLLARPGVAPRDALQDIWWALLNSNEFLLDH